MQEMKCDSCLNSRPIVSENGIHYGCMLSNKKATECIFGKSHFVEHPMKKEKRADNAAD